ncbi:MAG: thioredoxin-disulfide reductase [Thermoplasmatales archaeon]|nr:thioredoxin-disulfide reductase [Thermoplasmatales archaeon]
MDYEIAIIGAGPAGCSAGIYAGRGGAKAVIFDRGMGGGLAINSPKIENYPGFLSIGGVELMERMKEHASQYAEMRLFEEVKDIKVGEEIEVITDKGRYGVKVVIICTGTEPRKLNVKGEREFSGRGVSYCATCDGLFFKGKKVVVVGGGNSAVIEAIYLRNIGVDVSIVHRRDELRAEKIIEEEAIERGINFIWNSVVEEIFGKEKVEGIKIRNVKTNEVKEMSIDGVFVSIGEEPRNEIAKKVGLALDEHGFIKIDDMGKTNIDKIFAAGDITGGVRQIVVACSEGAKAAISAMKAIGKRSIW